MVSNELYKPVVPDWVGEILQKKKNRDPLATIGHSKEWDKWKSKYSRKYKYAMINGWTTENN